MGRPEGCDLVEDNRKNQLDEIPPSPSHRDRSRWYAAFFLLSVVNIVTIVAGILLNGQLARQYEGLNEQNRYWSEHLTAYAELETLLTKARAPGRRCICVA